MIRRWNFQAQTNGIYIYDRSPAFCINALLHSYPQAAHLGRHMAIQPEHFQDSECDCWWHSGWINKRTVQSGAPGHGLRSLVHGSMGNQDFFVSTTVATQPVSQFLKIHSGVSAAYSEAQDTSETGQRGGSATTDDLSVAMSQNPELLAAQPMVTKARAGVNAAHAEYVPDISIFAQDVYQNGAPLLPENSGAVGIRMDWTVSEVGKRIG